MKVGVSLFTRWIWHAYRLRKYQLSSHSEWNLTPKVIQPEDSHQDDEKARILNEKRLEWRLEVEEMGKRLKYKCWRRDAERRRKLGDLRRRWLKLSR